jgi:hypothetical protein
MLDNALKNFSSSLEALRGFVALIDPVLHRKAVRNRLPFLELGYANAQAGHALGLVRCRARNPNGICGCGDGRRSGNQPG